MVFLTKMNFEAKLGNVDRNMKVLDMTGRSTIFITNQVVQESYWTEEVLQARQNRLIQLLVNE